MRSKVLACGALLVFSLGAGTSAAARTMDDDSFVCTIGVGIYKVQSLVGIGPDLMTPVDAVLGCHPWVDD
jgi:hypothetical protein